mmetsp:Transcript_35728/g.96068  ORF Transcript_35728/g.96068 Transcript_35728/m.96068 type:complete len:90 (-) Transcript_35728:5-274(-)
MMGNNTCGLLWRPRGNPGRIYAEKSVWTAGRADDSANSANSKPGRRAGPGVGTLGDTEAEHSCEQPLPSGSWAELQAARASAALAPHRL